MKLKKFLSLMLSAAMAFTLLTATAFAAAPAEEENDFFDFLLGKKYTYLYAALTWDEYWANETVYAAGSTAASYGQKFTNHKLNIHQILRICKFTEKMLTDCYFSCRFFEVFCRIGV